MTNQTEIKPGTMDIKRQYAIEVSQLIKTYGKNVKALDHLTFSVKSGSIFGLLGPNGAGKSTAVKVLTTLTQPDGGTAKIAGIDVNQRPDDARKSIGYVAQESGVDPQCTGRENLMLQGQLYGLSRKELHSRISELLNRFDLLDVGNRLCRTYSGGMQRRMDIAMGLIHDPNILFLDEPTTGLDPEAQNAVTMIIQALIMILLSLALGARFAGGIPGILILIICGVLVGVGFGALSMALALLIRKEQGLMSAVGFAMMPLMFLSGLFMPLDLVPGWIQTAAHFNPVNWAGVAGREALGTNIDWTLIMSHSGYLLAFVIVSIWLATRAFHKYQRSA